ncbi:IS66 family transposase [Brenneria tiliae]|uniref:IS66 family transposase n=1 Tax=Brenneria tiliae TaxID=2914984 RepID=UPI00201502E6|nr:IS66 family transposase [Brenneria tiliae]MCL2898189.1 IS66 family transposase [Brenneria tiliae]MCL2902539.1 IS66 family transposase [Brenneria tiliae]
MANEIKDKLITVVASLHEQGMTPEQALEHILQAWGGTAKDIALISPITPRLIADVLHSVYQDAISARQIATILQRLGYDRQAIADTLRGLFPELARASGGAAGT